MGCLPQVQSNRMTNKEIAKSFSELADLMELHDANAHKVRTYRNAYVSIRRFPEPLEELEIESIMDQRGIGKAVAFKIEELLDYGQMDELEEWRKQTPEGVQEMMQVKGLGPKKIKTIWKELNIDNVADLIYACHENRLVEAKGFGEKTQTDLLKKLDFFMNSRDKHHYATAESLIEEIQSMLLAVGIASHWSGELLRRTNVVDTLELWCHGNEENLGQLSEEWTIASRGDKKYILCSEEGLNITLKFASETLEACLISEAPEFVQPHLTILTAGWNEFPSLRPIPELWDWSDLAPENWLHNDVIQLNDVKGVIHNHSTYSDGSHTLEQMAQACQQKGYEYLVISDHSKSAFYANGLDEDRVLKQWEEIDRLNSTFTDFKIFKSIESDILYDGSLDYDDEFLQGFDLVIASVHSQLRMDEEKATDRLVKAVEHPATRILGHMTSRLLLGRAGYPVDHAKVIEVCAKNNVVIELNASPYRLDMDWSWIPMAVAQGVLISINPDAHHIDGIDDIRYGVYSARKGGLLPSQCLCCKSLSEFELWIEQ